MSAKKAMIRLALAGTVLAVAAPVTLAQGQNNVPQVEIIRWEVFPASGRFFFFYNPFSSIVVYDRDLGIGDRFDIDSYLHQELDFVLVTIEVTDGDWTGDPEGGDEPFFVRFTAFGDWTWAPPEPTPIAAADENFFGVTADEGFTPPAGQTVA